MKKFYMLLLMTMVMGSAFANKTYTIALNSTSPSAWTTAGDVITASGDGFDFTITKGESGATANMIQSNHVRLYADTQFKIATDKTILQVVLNCTQGGAATIGGQSYPYEDGSITWESEEGVSEFLITAFASQTRPTEVVITTNEKDAAEDLDDIAITLSPAPGIYGEPQNVKVTVANTVTDYTVKYSIDGAAAVAYDDEAGIAIEKSCQLTVTVAEALIEGASEARGASTTVSYTISEGTVVSTLEEAKALALGTQFTFAGTMHYAYQYKSGRAGFTYVADETGGALIYGTAAPTLDQGTVIKPGWTALRSSLGIQSVQNFESAGTTVEVTPKEYAVSDITTDDRFTYAIVKGVSVKNVDGSNFTIADADGNELAGVNTFSAVVTLPEEVEGKTFNITGIIELANNAPVLRPTQFQEAEPADEGVNTIAKYLALEDNAEFTFTGEAYVTYQNASDKRYIYIADATGAALIYDNTKSYTLSQGTVLAAGWSGKKTNYNGLYEITAVAGIAAKADAEPVTVEPAAIAVTGIVAEKQNTYSSVKGVSLTVNNRNFTITDAEGNTAAGYNTFTGTVTLPTDAEGKTYDLTGFVSVNNNNPQFIPTEIIPVGGDEPEETIITSLEEFYELEDGTEFTFNGENTYVNYQNGKYLYLLQDIYDENGNLADTYPALIYGNIGIDYELGDIIEAGWKGKKSVYRGLSEIVNVTGLKEATEKVDDVEELTAAFDYNYYMATAVDYPEGAQNYKFLLSEVEIEDLDESGNFKVHQLSYYIDPETGDWAVDENGYGLTKVAEIECFNKFGIEMPANTNGQFEIEGMASIFDGEFQFYPISVKPTALDLMIVPLLEDGDAALVGNTVQVGYVDEESKTLYVTDNLYGETEIYGFVIEAIPTWVALNCSDDIFDAIKDAKALKGIEGIVRTPDVNPAIELTVAPVVADDEAAELVIFTYDMADEDGVMGARANSLAHIDNGFYLDNDGKAQLVGDKESLTPAVDLDFAFFTGEPWKAGAKYSTDVIVKVKEAWTYDDNTGNAPASVPFKQGRNTVNVKEAKRAAAIQGTAARKAPRRIAEDAPNYYDNYVFMPIGAVVTAVERLNADKQVTAVEYINTLGQRAGRAFDGVNIVVTTFSDGSKTATKAIF